MALLQVVQHVLHALGNALAFGVYGFLLRLGVEGQEVAGRRRCGPLLHRKTNTRLGFVIGVQGFGQSHHGAGIEQIQGGRKRCHRVVLPRLSRKATVFELGVVEQALLPQCQRILGVSRLQLGNFVGVKTQVRYRGHGVKVITVKSSYAKPLTRNFQSTKQTDACGKATGDAIASVGKKYLGVGKSAPRRCAVVAFDRRKGPLG